ncbi:hypothetical protein D1614_05940 [Maribellus luteus]|uniref:Uncharacterized protein n=1 Tax=Maribellus luteus TaxID=2305463 RepID=A0A399T5F8_9BACT|nr:hypothetical protein D1614_05940 [Maribellus luteus]
MKRKDKQQVLNKKMHGCPVDPQDCFSRYIGLSATEKEVLLYPPAYSGTSSKPPAPAVPLRVGGQLRPTAPLSGVWPKRGVKNIIYLSSLHYAHSKKVDGVCNDAQHRNGECSEAICWAITNFNRKQL